MTLTATQSGILWAPASAVGLDLDPLRVDLLRRRLQRLVTSGGDDRIPVLVMKRPDGGLLRGYRAVVVAVGRTMRGIQQSCDQLSSAGVRGMVEHLTEVTGRAAEPGERFRFEASSFTVDEVCAFLGELAWKLVLTDQSEYIRAGRRYLAERGLIRRTGDSLHWQDRAAGYERLGW